MIPFRVYQPTYERLPKDESEAISMSEDSTSHPPTRPFSRKVRHIGVGIISTVQLVIIVVLAYQLIIQHIPRKQLSCGSTVEEAKAHGCTFDLLTVSWLPPQCSREGYQQYHDFSLKHRLPHYLVNDTNSETVGPDALAVHEGQYYTTYGEHLTHCAYMLLRLHAAVMDRNLRVDNMALKPHHTSHCADFLLEAASAHPEFDKVTSYGLVTFGTC
jgi:hypothetical protein